MFRQLVTVLLLFTAYFATPGDAFGDEVWTGLSVTWPMTGNSGPYDLPTNIDDAEEDGWTEIEGALPTSDTQDALNLYLDVVAARTLDVISCMGYEGNARYVLCFNSLGDVVGIQNAIPVSDLKAQDMPIDYDNHDGIVTKTLDDVEYYVVEVYLFIDVDGNRRIFIVDSSGLNEVPTTAEGLSGTKFLKKNCVATMGVHYYQLNSTSDCAKFYPLVLLTDGTDVISVAVQIIGTTSTDSTRVWNENIPAAGVTVACSDAPDCFPVLVAEYGIYSLHTWFVPEPLTITCSDE